ncbi:acyltransferase family protein [Butyrivibrio sp. AE3006]|uniref:acyltransferase family protein n=1 Tax=Butyrivibrio sp. AE3006 TaxID=1280673 RepID=UPI0004069F0B|nr:acyltransferase [Butyrivibrio sp. AE3006]
MQNIQYIALYIFLIALCFVGAKIRNDKQENCISIQANVNSLRGVFAIFIIYTHCTLAINDLPLILIPLRKVSTFGVGFFFVVSGFGLAYSFGTKQDYLKGFFRKRVSKIVVFSLVSRIVSELIEIIMLGKKFSLKSIFVFNWYIYSLIILYILFFAVYKVVERRDIRVIAIWASVIFVTLVFLYLNINIFDFGRSYFISQWAFPFGITIYECHDEIDKLMEKYKIQIFAAMAVLLGFSFIWALKSMEYSISDLVSHNLMLIPFYYFVMRTCKYVTFDNVLLRGLKTISFEIYLYHRVVMVYFKNVLPTIDIWFFVLVTLVSIVISFVMNKFDNIVGIGINKVFRVR